MSGSAYAGRGTLYLLKQFRNCERFSVVGFRSWWIYIEIRADIDIWHLQGIPPTHEHLGPGMELDNGSSNAMEMRPADAEWLVRNAQELNGESTRSDFLRNYR
jgi:hypothetical protein